MPNKKKHPWRICPLGEHWVRTHPRKVPISKKNPDGVTIVDAHCRKNPSGHEIFVPDEIEEISSKHFKNVKNRPMPNALGFPHGNDFDEFIAGWTQFWNDVFEPKEPLDPNLVKALIATESSFKVDISVPSKVGKARGLIQITEQTRKILRDSKGELKDYLIDLSKTDSLDPNMNLCAGIRWLHHKKYLASHRLKREATWMEAIAEYKGILNQLGRVEKSDYIMSEIERYYKNLKTSRKIKGKK